MLQLGPLVAEMHPGRLIQVAGRPSTGRTSLGLRVALEIECGCLTGDRIAIFTPMSSRTVVFDRLVSLCAGVDRQIYINGLAKPAEVERWKQAQAYVGRGRFLLNDTMRLDFAEVRAAVRRWREDYRLPLVLIDDVRHVASSGLLGSELKALAEEAGATVLVLAPLALKVDRRRDHRPRPSDLLKTTGVPAEACDVVGFLWRPAAYFENRIEPENKAELIISKGTTPGTTELDFDELIAAKRLS